MSHEELLSELGSDELSVLDGPTRSLAPDANCYLAERAAEARMAIGRTLRDMRENVSGLLGIRSCALRHPWIASGSAAATGFVAGVLLVPRKRKRRRSKRHATRVAETPPQAPGPTQETHRATRAALFSFAGTILASILPPLFRSWLTPVDGNTQPLESKDIPAAAQPQRNAATTPSSGS